MTLRVLVTGGAGYIGSHVVIELTERGHEATIADSFDNSDPAVVDRLEQILGGRIRLHEVDLLDAVALDRVMALERPDAVIHFAGLKAVGESVDQPLRYYTHNLVSTLNLLASMKAHDVKTLVFSSSATVYGDRRTPPFHEDADDLGATNPYGQTKVMIERILTDVARAESDWSIAILRYFNPVGAHPSGLIGEDPNSTPNNLAPYIAQVAIGRLEQLSVFGDDYDTADGTGERDYVHVQDLASGHVAALEALERAPGVHVWNLGTGRATSVLDLLHAFEAAVGRPLPYRIAPRRDGDIAQAWADTGRAEAELGWKARLTVEDMARDQWNWQRKNPRGYRG